MKARLHRLELSIFVLLALAQTGYSQSKSATKELDRVVGKWEVVAYESKGVKTPRHVGQKYEFFPDGTFQLTSTSGEVFPKRKFTLDVKKDPKQMDWSVKIHQEDKTVTEDIVKCIYRFEDEKLVIYKAILSGWPRPTEFSKKQKESIEVFTLKRLPSASTEKQTNIKENPKPTK